MKADLIQKQIISHLFKGKKILGTRYFPSGEIIVRLSDSFLAVFAGQQHVPDTQFFLNSNILTEGHFEQPEEIVEWHMETMEPTGLYKKSAKSKGLLKQLVSYNYKRQVVFTAWIDNKIMSYYQKEQNLKFVKSPNRHVIYIYDRNRLYGIVTPIETEGQW